MQAAPHNGTDYAQHFMLCKKECKQTTFIKMATGNILGQLDAAAAARSASVSLLQLGGKSGARLPMKGTFASGLMLTGRLCCDRSDLCSTDVEELFSIHTPVLSSRNVLSKPLQRQRAC